MQNLVSFSGIFVLIFLAWLISEDRNRFPWRVVIWGLLLQMIFGFLVLRWEPGANAFLKLNAVFNALLGFSKEGAYFVFNALALGPGEARGFDKSLGFFFAFQVLTTIIFFSALLSVLYYLGVMQKIVLLFAKIMAYTMRVSGAEALSNSANIFVGQTEAPLVVRPYIEKMTRSEIMSIMVGGFANTAGGVLGAYIMMLQGYFPNIASHLISASLLSAPAGFIFAKVLVPEKEEPLTMGEVKMEVEIEDANVIDAAANGTTVGWQLAINVAAMLISFVALIAMVNLGVDWLGGFFRGSAGFLQINLMIGASLLALAAVEVYGPPRDIFVWPFLGLLGALALGAHALAAREMLDPIAARTVALVAIALWVPLFLQCDAKKSWGKKGWVPVLVLIVVADLAYLWMGPLGPDSPLSIQIILGWLHWPIAFIMGVPSADCLAVGRLLGEKLILTEFIAYLDLANLLGAAGRGEVPALDPRSVVILTYALCGFANFASIAIQIGGIAPLAPSRRHDIARLGFKAMVGGALATYMIACVAGTFYTGRSMLGAEAAVAASAAAEAAKFSKDTTAISVMTEGGDTGAVVAE
jgi:concentrative nucleoside transporter, CNT family